MKPVTIHTLDSIKAKTIEEGDCWIWQGAMKNGHPASYYDGAMRSTRRLIHSLMGKQLQGKYFGCTCGTPACVAPDHIIQRTEARQQAFITERASKGSVKEIRIRKMTQTRRASSAKLTLEDARQIRQSPHGLDKLAAIYSVDRSLIGKIRRNQVWREVSSPWMGLVR